MIMIMIVMNYNSGNGDDLIPKMNLVNLLWWLSIFFYDGSDCGKT